MEISDILTPERVFEGVQASDKPALLHVLARQAASELQMNEADIFAALLARERLGSTGIGHGVAIPHARIPGLRRIYCAFFKPARPIEFGAVDDIAADVVVLLLIPQSDERSGIQALSCIARRLKAAGVLEQVRNSKRSGSLFDLIAGRTAVDNPPQD